MTWNDLPITQTTHTLRVLEPTGGTNLPVTSKLIRSLPHPNRTASVWEVRYMPDGRLFTTGYPSGIIQIWDPNTGKELRRIDSPPGYRGSANYAVTDVALKTLYVAVEGRKFIPNTDRKKPARIEYDGHLLVWDLATGKSKEPVKAEKGHGVIAVSLSPDGTRVITTERGGHLASEGGTDVARLIDLTTGKATKLGDGYCLATFTPDSKRVYVALTTYSGKKSAVLKVFDRDGKELARLDELKSDGFGVPALSRDGKHLAVTLDHGQINQPGALRLYDRATNKLVAEFPSGGDYPFFYMTTFSPDGRLVAACDYDSRVRVWDVATKKVVLDHKFTDKAPGMHVAFNKDGSQLAVPVRIKTDDDRQRDPDPRDFPQPRLVLFDLKKGGDPVEHVLPHGWASEVCYSADGRTLAVGSAGAVHLLDVSK